MEALIDRFNNLGGRTISEHKKAFNLYKSNLDNFNPEQIDSILNGIKSYNNQEHIFRVVLMQKYEKNERLLQTLCSGNKILSKLILKDTKFVRNLVRNVTADVFIREICPKISYVNRAYVITMLSNHIDDSAIGDAYYKAVLGKFGFQAASALLVVCSEDLVHRTITENKFKLTDRQIMKLYKKYSGFLCFYFEKCGNSFGGYSILAQKLILSEMDTFHELLKFGEPHVGKRAFVHYLQAHKQEIIEHKYYSRSHNRLVRNFLNEQEYALYFKNSFPKQLSDFDLYQTINKLKILPINTRGKLLFSTYQEVYDVPFGTYSTNLLSILSLEYRMMFDIKTEDIEFDSIDKSIPFIKEQINLTSAIALRSNLITKLITTCKINNDTEALGEVLKYFANRHKNDQLQIRTDFLFELRKLFKIDKLSDEDWEFITDLLLTFEVKEEYFYNKTYYLVMLIKKKIENGMDYRNELVSYVKENWQKYGSLKLDELKRKDQKECILNYVELIPQLIDENERKYEFVLANFITTLHDWNVNNPKDQICYYDYRDFLQVLFEALDDEESKRRVKYAILDIICYIPKKYEDKLLHNEFLEKYIQTCSYDLYKINLWILKHKPDLIIKFTDEFMKNSHGTAEYFYEISKMHFIELPNVLYAAAMKIVEANDENNLSSALACLVHSDDYLKIIEKFHPEFDCNIDIHTRNMRDLLNVRIGILNSFKQFVVPIEAIDVVLRYCRKDYLQYALEPLYSIMYHSTLEKIEIPLKELLNRAVSVRKHAIYLTAMLADVNYIMDVLKRTGATEKNVSIQKFIFKRTFMFFCNNPSEAALELVVSHLVLLNRNDTESFAMLMCFSKIPHKYLATYFRYIYNYVKSFNEGLEFRIISFIDKDLIQLLESEFCDGIIKEGLFNKNNSYNIDAFVYNYLRYSGDLKQHRFDVFGERIIAAIDLDADFIQSGKRIDDIFNLFKSICTHIILENNVDLGKSLLKCFKSLKLLADNLELEIMLEATTIYADGFDLDKLVQYFVEIKWKLLYETFGFEIETFYKRSVLEFAQIVLEAMEGSKIENGVKLASEFNKKGNNSLAKLLAIDLMPRDMLKSPSFINFFNETIESISTNSNPVIEIYLGAYLTELL